ncbi:unnamed protein product [Sphagnum troendelagicum]|uniref:Macro domain-containing protein n=1 Tax=Sphagnum troendelagicum TaxID=128251 RepID=A0ABP0UMV5_9BRYO
MRRYATAPTIHTTASCSPLSLVRRVLADSPQKQRSSDRATIDVTTSCSPQRSSIPRTVVGYLVLSPSRSVRRGLAAAPVSSIPGGAGGENRGPRDGKWFRISDSCSLALHRGDITKWFVDGKTDAIVNAANEAMLGGGGVDGAIHSAAGPELYAACYAVPEVTRGVRCPTGSAVITGGFNLPASKVIHTVGPIYSSDEVSAEPLAKAYRSSVAVATGAGVKYIAFPAISCGVYGYPHKKAAKIAIQTLKESSVGLLEVHFVLFNESIWNVWLAEAEACLEKA